MKPKTTRLRVRLDERKRRSTTPPPPVAERESDADAQGEDAEPQPEPHRPIDSTHPGLQPTPSPKPRNAQTLRLERPSAKPDSVRRMPNAPPLPTVTPHGPQSHSPSPPPPQPYPPQYRPHSQHSQPLSHPAQLVANGPPVNAPPAHAPHGHDDLDNEFFATPPPPQHVEAEDDLHDGNFEEWERARRGRRAQFIRPVAWVVGVCVVIGIAATVRHYLPHGAEPLAQATPAASDSSASLTAPSALASAGNANMQNTPIASASAVASADPRTASDAGVANSAELDASVAMAVATDAATLAVASADDAGAAVAHSPEDAAKEKRRAQRALDSGRFKEAIAAGEQSVALDPDDAEAWLLLGAAYQETGDRTNANRCFHACLTQAKRGDRSECSAMLH